MESRFLTNYTDTTFLSTIQMNLRRCKAFDFSVSFIKKAGLVLRLKISRLPLNVEPKEESSLLPIRTLQT